MADAFNRFNTGGQYYYPTSNAQHPRNLHHRNGSPINNNRTLFQPSVEASPNRSPGTNSPATHTPFGMYNHNNHRQNHGLLNGGAAHTSFQPQIGLNKAFQTQNHNHAAPHLNSQHQEHGLAGHGSAFGNHQHSISNSTLSNNTPHFTPAHIQNGTPSSADALSKPPNEHWAEQLRECRLLRLADHKAHFYARTTSINSRFPGTTGAANGGRGDGEDNGDKRRTATEESDEMGAWDAMDLCGQGLKGMAPALFRHYPNLRKLYLNWNRLRQIPPQIGQMRLLTTLDLSMNELRSLPPEIGTLTNLKKLLLYDNHLDDLPYEIGSLFQLEMLGIEGNPLRPELKERLVNDGTQELVRYLREQAPRPPPPMDRNWIPLAEDVTEPDTFTVLSWNILCDRAATAAQYGYTPSEALNWQRRRELLFDEMTGRNADIMCLQEVDVENYHEFFRPNLATHDYKGVYAPKSRARTMQEKEAKSVDGSAIFVKNSKYMILDKQVIVFSQEALNRPDMKGEHDVYNRVMPRDHIAIVVLLENRQTGSRLIVTNTHLTWEPWFSDIKIVQVAILMEYLAKLCERYAQWEPVPIKDKQLYKYGKQDSPNDDEEPDTNPSAAAAKPHQPAEPGPSMRYDSGIQLPLVICGDFNSTRDSGVYDLITQGSLSNSHAELGNNNYGDFTRHGMSHPFSLKSAYSHIGELPFTNFTPDFRQVIDWVFYSSNTVNVTNLLGEVDPDYMRRVPGWPNHYFPSDHLALVMEFAIKERREKRAPVEADFGNGSTSSNGNGNAGASGTGGKRSGKH